MQTLPPSSQDYNFRTADLGNADISPEAAARVMLQLTGGRVGPDAVGGLETGDKIAALLAQLVKETRRGNCGYQPYPFTFAAYQQQQIVTANPWRQYLMIQNVGNNDLMVLFEECPPTLQTFSGSAADQQTLTIKQTRALRIVSGGYFEPLTVPTNAITLFTLNGATNGLLVDGR